MAEGGLEAAVPSRDELVRRAAALVEPLAARAGETERLRRLHPDTVEDLLDSGLWGVHRPFRYGGSEGDFGLIVDIGEQLGRACPSTSWVWVNLVSHNWMLGMWPERAQDAVWGAEPGRADRLGDGLPAGTGWSASTAAIACRGAGRSPAASRSRDWVMLGGMMPPEDADGPPKPCIFVVDCRDVEVIDTWDVVGLVGTGSHDVACQDVFVPDYMALSPHDMRGAPTPGSAVNPASLYRLPLLGMFSHIIAGAMLGAARGALDHLHRIDAVAGRDLQPAAHRRPRRGPAQDRRGRRRDPRHKAAAARRPARGPRHRRGGPNPDRRGEDRAGARTRPMPAANAPTWSTCSTRPREGRETTAATRSSASSATSAPGVTHIGVSWDANGAEHGRALLGLPHGNFLL